MDQNKHAADLNDLNAISALLDSTITSNQHHHASHLNLFSEDQDDAQSYTMVQNTIQQQFPTKTHNEALDQTHHQHIQHNNNNTNHLMHNNQMDSPNNAPCNIQNISMYPPSLQLAQLPQQQQPQLQQQQGICQPVAQHSRDSSTTSSYPSYSAGQVQQIPQEQPQSNPQMTMAYPTDQQHLIPPQNAFMSQGVQASGMPHQAAASMQPMPPLSTQQQMHAMHPLQHLQGMQMIPGPGSMHQVAPPPLHQQTMMASMHAPVSVMQQQLRTVPPQVPVPVQHPIEPPMNVPSASMHPAAHSAPNAGIQIQHLQQYPQAPPYGTVSQAPSHPVQGYGMHQQPPAPAAPHQVQNAPIHRVQSHVSQSQIGVHESVAVPNSSDFLHATQAQVAQIQAAQAQVQAHAVQVQAMQMAFAQSHAQAQAQVVHAQNQMHLHAPVQAAHAYAHSQAMAESHAQALAHGHTITRVGSSEGLQTLLPPGSVQSHVPTPMYPPQYVTVAEKPLSASKPVPLLPAPETSEATQNEKPKGAESSVPSSDQAANSAQENQANESGGKAASVRASTPPSSFKTLPSFLASRIRENENRPVPERDLLRDTKAVFSELRKSDGTRYSGDLSRTLRGALCATGFFVKSDGGWAIDEVALRNYENRLKEKHSKTEGQRENKRRQSEENQADNAESGSATKKRACDRLTPSETGSHSISPTNSGIRSASPALEGVSATTGSHGRMSAQAGEQDVSAKLDNEPTRISQMLESFSETLEEKSISEDYFADPFDSMSGSESESALVQKLGPSNFVFMMQFHNYFYDLLEPTSEKTLSATQNVMETETTVGTGAVTAATKASTAATVSDSAKACDSITVQPETQQLDASLGHLKENIVELTSRLATVEGILTGTYNNHSKES
mmetsp:Transcript_8125/g.14714  ORF Transcript_8125/g.14714 Transcript_8125/m.14714 type:complete len:897 (-) Transcript_8125:799-3489(-)